MILRVCCRREIRLTIVIVCFRKDVSNDTLRILTLRDTSNGSEGGIFAESSF
jgi:hypothetical protein